MSWEESQQQQPHWLLLSPRLPWWLEIPVALKSKSAKFPVQLAIGTVQLLF